MNLRIEEEVTKTLHLVAGLYTRMGHTIGEDPELRKCSSPSIPAQMERRSHGADSQGDPAAPIQEERPVPPLATETEE